MSLFKVVFLLACSNTFMLFAWYSHLRNMPNAPVWQVVLVSWSIALFEYMLMVPANRIGNQFLTLPQLKIMQEVITLSVFVPFAIFYMRKPITWNYLWASLCILGAVFFIFRDKMGSA
ncbi:MAG: DMT family protein [Planctomycetia bacterium]|nr:DMT family protein [Planctomycetia bacterium]